MQAHIESINHNDQAYDTAGNWQIRGANGSPNFSIQVSRTKNWRYDFLVGLHELVEVAICHHNGIRTETVTDFDEKYEELRSTLKDEFERKELGRGFVDLDSEPGDHPDAPYGHEHQIATVVERIVAGALGVDWETYDTAIRNLGPWRPKDAPETASAE